MSAAQPSSKRPLDDRSSDGVLPDQPEAKRPALEKDSSNGTANAGQNAQSLIANGKIEVNGSNGTTVAQNDGPVDPQADDPSVAQTLPIQSSVNASGHAIQSDIPNKQDEAQWLHVRAIISSAEAATLIGKGGENVQAIRKSSGAKCTVSEYSRGAVERILTVSGTCDALGKAFGLIIRTLLNEPLDTKSDTNSKTYALRLLVPHVLVGAVIGSKGARIREIQEASGAKLNASEACLPLSTERGLTILGVADAVHIASYYVCSTLNDQLVEKYGGPAASAYANRHGHAIGAVPGGMQVIPYAPASAGGQWGPPETYNRTHPQMGRPQPAHQPQHQQQQQQQQGYPSYPPQATHTHTPVQGQPSTPMHYQAQPRHGYHGAGPHMPSPQAGYPQQQQPMMPQGGMPAGGQQGFGAQPGQPLTQQIYIPNDMVGAIIGKGGAKINEIRQLSGSVIKINEPQDNSNERLVTITGTQECNQMALYMLYQRLGEFKVHGPANTRPG